MGASVHVLSVFLREFWVTVLVRYNVRRIIALLYVHAHVSSLVPNEQWWFHSLMCFTDMETSALQDWVHCLVFALMYFEQGEYCWIVIVGRRFTSGFSWLTLSHEISSHRTSKILAIHEHCPPRIKMIFYLRLCGHKQMTIFDGKGYIYLVCWVAKYKYIANWTQCVLRLWYLSADL